LGGDPSCPVPQFRRQKCGEVLQGGPASPRGRKRTTNRMQWSPSARVLLYNTGHHVVPAIRPSRCQHCRRPCTLEIPDKTDPCGDIGLVDGPLHIDTASTAGSCGG